MSSTPVPKLNRRGFLGVVALAAAGAAATRAEAGIELAAMRGTVGAEEFGVRPGAQDDQSRAFQRMLEKSSDTGTPVFLPAGVYRVSNINLPRAVRLSGVPGETRIVYGGDGFLFSGETAETVELIGLEIDGANRWIGDQAHALIDLRGAARVVIDDCRIVGSGRSGIALERCAGRIEHSLVSGAADIGIYAVESAGLSITGNTVSDCGNGGILVHRWQSGDDGTIVSGNRVERIASRNGGTGQWGNGINVFRADRVIVTNNNIADCAFSAIRANTANNIQIGSNTCLRSGETGLYAEFAFEGAVISANIVDGAANGISVVNFNEGGRAATVIGNLVRNLSSTGPYPPDPPGFGIGISVEADTTVTGNMIENAPVAGIQIGWGPFMRDVVATGNVVRDSRVGVAVTVVEGAGAAVIADNVISGASAGAVVGYRWADAVTGDMTTEGSAYPHLTVERNKVS